MTVIERLGLIGCTENVARNITVTSIMLHVTFFMIDLRVSQRIGERKRHGKGSRSEDVT